MTATKRLFGQVSVRSADSRWRGRVVEGTVTAGIVSATDRDTRLGAGGSRQPAVQTDASINPGNSGGPLVDATGRVVGVNTSIATLGTGSPGNIGIGFAIPVDRATAVAEQLISRACTTLDAVPPPRTAVLSRADDQLEGLAEGVELVGPAAAHRAPDDR